MNPKRIAIAVVAVMSLASLGGAALAKTPAAGQNTFATSSEPTTGADGATETESGSAADPDGTGGHEDPAGNVDHQFDGQE